MKIFSTSWKLAGEVSIADGVKQADAELNASFERLKKQMGN